MDVAAVNIFMDVAVVTFLWMLQQLTFMDVAAVNIYGC